MADPTSFRLSRQTVEELDALATRFMISRADVLERLIHDRFSVTDQNRNARRRRLTWIEFRDKNDVNSMTPEALFIRGYNTGWVHFQTRHQPESEEFIIDIED